MKLCLFVTMSVTLLAIVLGLPFKTKREDSPISTVVIPYAPYTTELIKDVKGKEQKVYVPVHMNVVPKISLKQGEIAMSNQRGVALNIADGAYPVYYMPGNANGKFQNKMIYLLE